MRKPWWSSSPMRSDIHLKGAQKIVFDALCALLKAQQPVSVMALVMYTGYSHKTVRRSLRQLQSAGLITVQQYRRGQRASYQVLHGRNS